MILNLSETNSGGGTDTLMGYKVREYNNINPNGDTDGIFDFSDLDANEVIVGALCKIEINGDVDIIGGGSMVEERIPFYLSNVTTLLDGTSALAEIYDEQFIWESADLTLIPTDIMILTTT